MTTGSLVRLVVIDLIVVAAGIIAIGASAPRWPVRWLERDHGVLRLQGFETPGFYRRLRVSWWRSALPELGAAFGGTSKKQLLGTDAGSLGAYLVEVRRAEWVHWLACAPVALLYFFNPLWLALAWTLAVLAVNGIFIGVLRNNRIRLLRILERA